MLRSVLRVIKATLVFWPTEVKLIYILDKVENRKCCFGQRSQRDRTILVCDLPCLMGSRLINLIRVRLR